jgi:serine/threonine-protein kinase
MDSGETLLAARGLPPELLREAAKRLELVALILGAAYGFSLALTNLLQAGGWRQPAARPGLHNLIGASMVAVSAGVVWLSRSRRLGAVQFLDVGLVYEVLVALGISLQDNLAPITGSRPLDEISWVCVLIVMFPLAVPARPRKTLIAGVAAASMWPLAYFAGLRLGNAPAPLPVMLLNFLENYIAAALALVPAIIIRKLGADVQKAQQMGSYELVEPLGHGGMGEVWRARHHLLARPAAIKLIRPQALGVGNGAHAETLMRRFEREAQATAALHSPHTVELYDFGVTPDGTFYYVMEILDGLDLEQMVRRFGPVAPERAVYLLVQLCDSLADAHYAGLVHRDVKPANVYVCRKGPRHDFVKLLDFGLVKPTWREHLDDTSLTQDGAAPGTPAYLAPEIALGSPDVDGRADLYALGCVAYWLLTGYPVFQADTAMKLALQHVQAVPVPPSRRIGRSIPAALEDLVLACLEKLPEKRPATAAEVAARLGACSLETRWTEEDARRWWQAHLPSG